MEYVFIFILCFFSGMIAIALNDLFRSLVLKVARKIEENKNEQKKS